MLSLNNKISEGFIEIPQNKYKLNPEKISTFKKYKSVLNSFSNSVDMLTKKELDVMINKEESKKKQIYRGQEYDQNKKVSVKNKNSNSLTYRGKNYKS